MLRFLILSAIATLVSACGENPLQPNTDIGLRVWATVSPSSVSLRDATDSLRIRVYVANPADREITVITGGPPYVNTSNPANSKGLWGSFRIMDPGGFMRGGPAADWFGQPRYVFEPKRSEYGEHVLSLKEWIANGLKPGVYTIRSWFNAREGESARFTVNP